MGIPVEVPAVHDGTAHRCGVPVHVFGGGMGHDVCPPFKRAAVDGRGKRVVHNQGYTMFVGHAGKAFYVEHVAARVGDGFAEETFGVRAEGGFDAFIVPFRVDECAFDA